jgi:hypothetical protein
MGKSGLGAGCACGFLCLFCKKSHKNPDYPASSGPLVRTLFQKHFTKLTEFCEMLKDKGEFAK